jgi:hypothetical protein
LIAFIVHRAVDAEGILQQPQWTINCRVWPCNAGHRHAHRFDSPKLMALEVEVEQFFGQQDVTFLALSNFEKHLRVHAHITLSALVLLLERMASSDASISLNQPI